MKDLRVVFLPLARTTFHMESAAECYEKSLEVLKELVPSLTFPGELLTSPEMLLDYLKSVQGTLPNVVVVQCTTFVDSVFMSHVARELSCPIILWGVREPVIDGGRLRLNSLTGVYAAGNVLVSLGREFVYVFGAPTEANLRNELAVQLKAVDIQRKLKDLNVGVIGHFPPGFYFSNLEDVDLMRHIGPRVLRLEARDIMKRAGLFEEGETKQALTEAKQMLNGLDAFDEATLDKHARLRLAYRQVVEENRLGALATRCWPDFFVEYGASVCAAISGLTEKGIVSSCEADIGGAISMYIARELAGSAPYFGDPVSLDEEKNAITFWHCGAGACSLAHKDTGAKAGVHPNRKLGVTMEFGLKPGRVTVLRLGKGPQGYRMYLLGGEALDEPQQFWGTSVVIKTDNKAAEIVAQSVEQGWEAHFVVVYGDIRPEIKALCRLMNIPVVEF